jgi:hypothetical protein
MDQISDHETSKTVQKGMKEIRMKDSLRITFSEQNDQFASLLREHQAIHREI